jgi:threonine aldolase
MRQAGVLGAAALLALDDFSREDRAMLRADHRRARAFADALAGLPGVTAVTPPETNIVLFETVSPADTVVASLAEAGVGVVPFGAHIVRATFHRDADDLALTAALDGLRKVFR